MNIYVGLRLHTQNVPKDYKGRLLSENWTIGKKRPERLSSLAFGCVLRLVEFWWSTMLDTTPAEINAELERLAELLLALRRKEAGG